MARKKTEQASSSDNLPFIQCSYMACNQRAILREKVSTTAWANFCLHHYEERGRAKAEEYCLKLGLKTVAEKRAWVLKTMHDWNHRFRPKYSEHEEPNDEPIP